MSPSKEELEDMQRELERLIEELHSISEREKTVGEKMHPIELRATSLGADRVSVAIRASFVRLTDAGTLLTQAHLDMNVPPTVFHPDAVESGTPIGEQQQINQETADTQRDQHRSAA